MPQYYFTCYITLLCIQYSAVALTPTRPDCPHTYERRRGPAKPRPSSNAHSQRMWMYHQLVYLVEERIFTYFVMIAFCTGLLGIREIKASILAGRVTRHAADDHDAELKS